MSSDNNMELSRRKILGSIGAVGAAGAGAGLGTSALFSDTESFVNNSITAGELDLKVDWEEHYSFPQIYDEFGDPTDGITATRAMPDVPDEFTAFPPGVEADDGSDPLLWVSEGDVSQYMSATAIEGFPDSDNNGTAEFPDDRMFPDNDPCDVLADVPGDFGAYTDDSDGTLGRTDNADTRLSDGSPAPLINLNDVKPGDFGEVTFSTHLCDNPGYLWLGMPGGLDLDENGVTEPEGDSENEEDGTVELADEVRTALWYDNNCDNLTTGGDEKLDVLVVADTSKSQDSDDIDDIVSAGNTLIDELPKDEVGGEPRIRGGLMTFNGNTEDVPSAGLTLREPLGPLEDFDDDGDGNADIGDLFPNAGEGGTPTPHAIDVGSLILEDGGRSDARQILLLVTDGNPDFNPGQTYSAGSFTQSLSYDSDSGSDNASTCKELEETDRAADFAESKGIEILVTGIDIGTTDCDVANTPLLDSADIGSGLIEGDTFLRQRIASTINQFFDADNFPTLDDVTDAIALQLVGGGGDGDEIIFTGTLREAETLLTQNDGLGIPLDGDRDTSFDEETGDGVRERFPAFTTACFGFAWWVPTEVGNQIQSDRASFDLSFYAEQSRNNEDPGQSFSNT